jgi:hypothetical protein
LFESIFSFTINIPFPKSRGVCVNIPNVVSFKPGVHYFSPESLDEGFPIRVDSEHPLTISNVLFVSKKDSTLTKVLYIYNLSEAQTVHDTCTVLVPWKEAFKAAFACIDYIPRKHWRETFHIAVYDHFTDGMYASQPFIPLFLHSLAVECDEELDKLFQKACGFSLRKLSRAETLEERRRILGISDKDVEVLKNSLKSMSKNKRKRTKRGS